MSVKPLKKSEKKVASKNLVGKKISKADSSKTKKEKNKLLLKKSLDTNKKKVKDEVEKSVVNNVKTNLPPKSKTNLVSTKLVNNKKKEKLLKLKKFKEIAKKSSQSQSLVNAKENEVIESSAAKNTLQNDNNVKSKKIALTSDVILTQSKKIKDSKSTSELKHDIKLKNKAVIKSEDNSKASKKSKLIIQKSTDVSKKDIKSIKSKKRKLSETDEIKSNNISGPNLVKKEVAKYVTALLKLIATEEKEKKSLFDSEKPPILLYINCFKIPCTPSHQLRIALPHSLIKPDDDVALIVRDLKKGRRINYEPTVTYYQDLLEKYGVTQIKAIIPMNQLKTEYRQFEMRLKLLNLYDHFLIDGRVAGHASHLLGQKFYKGRKLPTSIHMNKDLKVEISNALQKATLRIHGRGDGSIIQIGHCSMTVNQITDNIIAVSKALNEHFPGGWNNIRQLSIKTPTSLSIPIYISLKNKNDVNIPIVTPKRPKAYQTVEGELSTFTSNVKVSVAPDGTVNVQKIDDGSDIDEAKDKNKDEEEKNKEDEDKEEEEEDED